MEWSKKKTWIQVLKLSKVLKLNYLSLPYGTQLFTCTGVHGSKEPAVAGPHRGLRGL